MKKFFIAVILLILISFSILLVYRNTIAKDGIEKGVYNLVGQKMTIGKVNVGLFKTDIAVEDIKVFNPEGYSKELLAEVPEIFINYALLDILKGFIHLPEIKLNIDEVNIEKDKNGVLNIDKFKVESEKNSAKSAKEKEQSGKDNGKKQFLADKVILEVGTIHYKDNTKSPAVEKEYKMNFSKTFTNVTDERVIISAITTEILSRLMGEGLSLAIDALSKGGKMPDLFKDKKSGLGKSTQTENSKTETGLNSKNSDKK